MGGPAAAALLPHPPLLVPELASGAAAELDPLRAACREALSAVLAAAGTTVIVGDGPVWGVAATGASGSFRPYGADVAVSLPPPALVAGEAGADGPGHRSASPPAAGGPGAGDGEGLPEPAVLGRLPLSLAVAAWLLAGLEQPAGRLLAATVPGSLGPGAAAAVGAGLVERAAGVGPVGLVAMADLSARRTATAPGAFHPEAAGFDGAVAAAVGTGRPDRLLDLDPGLAAELQVAGRVPLQVLAGAFRGCGPTRGRVLYADAPYGVGYLVGALTPQ
jgi:hypothetical protein